MAPKDPLLESDVIASRKLRFRFMKHTGWENALFVHWPLDPAVLSAHLPKGLEPDLFEGSAWIGLVLLTERGVSCHVSWGRKIIRPIDHFGANVRTYVRRGGIPGIYFWSLECSSVLASIGARLAGIPYFPAVMSRSVDIEYPLATPEAGLSTLDDSNLAKDGFAFEFASRRRGLWGSHASVSARWRLDHNGSLKDSDSDIFRARARFFLERYSVYAAWPWGRGPLLLRGDVQHPSWPVQPVILEALDAAELFAAAGLPKFADGLDAPSPHVCFSRGQGPIHFWMLEPV